MKSKAKTMMKGKAAPMPQRMAATPKSTKESKTARPAPGRQMNTPRVKNAPPAPERKKAPKW